MNNKQLKNIKRLSSFLIVGFLLILFFLGIKNKLEDFLFFEITKNIDIENNNLEWYYASLKPFRNWNQEPPEINALAAISTEILEDETQKFLYAKNQEKILSIASLTKLMTAEVAIDNYDLNQETIISPKAAAINGKINHFREGEKFYVKDLLYALLMESSNEAGQALAEIMGEQKFIQLMNLRAQEWELENTRFFNAHGLDPENPSFYTNHSTPKELTILTLHILKKPLIKQILTTKEFELYTAEKIFYHQVKNNNQFLDQSNQIVWQENILGGKTGWTKRAGGCLMLSLNHPKNNSVIINIILGSSDRFEEMKELTNWIYTAYRW